MSAALMPHKILVQGADLRRVSQKDGKSSFTPKREKIGIRVLRRSVETLVKVA